MTWNEWKTAGKESLRSRFYLYLVGNLRADIDATPFIPQQSEIRWGAHRHRAQRPDRETQRAARCPRVSTSRVSGSHSSIQAGGGYLTDSWDN